MGGILAWLAGMAAIVAPRLWEFPSFWLGMAVAVAVLFAIGGALVAARSGTRLLGLSGIPIVLALTGISVTTAAALHDLDEPWNGYLDIAAIVFVAGFAVTVVVSGTFGIAVTAGERHRPGSALRRSLIPGALGLACLFVDALVDFRPSVDACLTIATVVLLSAAVNGLVSSTTALIGGVEARDVAPLVTSFGCGGVAVVAAAEVTRSEFEPTSSWALVPLLVAIDLGVVLVAVCLLFALAVILGGTLLLSLKVVRDNWAPVATLGAVTLVLDLVVRVPSPWESWDSLIPAVLIPAGVLGFAAAVFLRSVDGADPAPGLSRVSMALAGSIAAGTFAVVALTAAVAFDAQPWGSALLLTAAVVGVVACVASSRYAVGAPQPVPVLATTSAHDLPEPDGSAASKPYGVWRSAAVETVKAPVHTGGASQAEPVEEPIGKRRLREAVAKVMRHWKAKLNLGDQLNLLVQVAMLLLTLISLVVTVALK
jgi:hypothetical protein